MPYNHFFGRFSTMSKIIPVFFAIIVILMILSFVRNFSAWRSNSKQPIIPIPALVLSKREYTTINHDADGSHTSTTYYVTFVFANGEQMELPVGFREYYRLNENDRGTLSLQGTQYRGFEFQ